MSSMNTVTLTSVMGRAAFQLTPIPHPDPQHALMPLVFFKMPFGFCSLLHLLLVQEFETWPKVVFLER